MGAGGYREPRKNKKEPGSWLPAAASCLGWHAHPAGRSPNSSSLLLPLAAVVAVALGCFCAVFSDVAAAVRIHPPSESGFAQNKNLSVLSYVEVFWWARVDIASRAKIKRNPGRGSQRLRRALGGTRILLAAAPTAPPCFCRWQRSSLLHWGFFVRRTIRRALRVALAAFSAAPWQGFEKAERCPSLASLFPPQAAVGSAAVRIHP